ncbi:hypothetical protein MCOR34_004826 [Pyricularia oryzae]|nr:hypothetical protein MCOR34_004826 [Pyricularia oryzae]KAI6510177.1 hypothetical protein MCOR13_001240 [Pyricularia oryzae]KAI6555657.1 hypothetical protein MCOR04_010404 [Pyricularia oryzae]
MATSPYTSIANTSAAMRTTQSNGQNGQNAVRQRGTPTTISVILNCLTCGMIAKDYRQPQSPPVPEGPVWHRPTADIFDPDVFTVMDLNMTMDEWQRLRFERNIRRETGTDRPPLPRILVTPPA